MCFIFVQILCWSYEVSRPMAESFMKSVSLSGTMCPLGVGLHTGDTSAPWSLPQLIWSEGSQAIRGEFKGITHAEQNEA